MIADEEPWGDHTDYRTRKRLSFILDSKDDPQLELWEVTKFHEGLTIALKIMTCGRSR